MRNHSKLKFLSILRTIKEILPTNSNELISDIEKNWNNSHMHIFYHDFILNTISGSDNLITNVLNKVYNFPKNLPLLEEYSRWAKVKEKIDLQDYSVVAIQHILGSNYELFKWLNNVGVPFHNMYVIGKAYSSNPLIANFFESKGININVDLEPFRDLTFFNNERKYDDLLYTEIKSFFLDAINKNSNRKILIIDDGAIAIKCALDLKKVIDFSAIAVEQTRFGSKYIRSKEINHIDFPIINAAETNSKLSIESLLIGRSIVDEISNRINTLDYQNKLNASNALVVGYGSIGASVSEELRKVGYHVLVYDKERRKNEKARINGFEIVDIKYGLKNSKLIVGCTGERWFDKQHFDLLKNDLF